MPKTKSKKNLTPPKKSEATDGEALLPIIQDLVNASAAIMKISSMQIANVELKGELLHFELKGAKTFSCAPSALYKMLDKIFADTAGFSTELLFVLYPRPASLYRAFFGRRESLIILRLITFLSAHANESEARLCAIQSQILEDFRKGLVQIGEDFQDDVQIGKDLFSKLKLKSEKLLVSTSEIATVMKLLPVINGSDTYEALFCAVWSLQYFPKAFEVSGKKREDLIAQLSEVQRALEKHPHELLRDYSQFFLNLLNSASVSVVK